MASTWIWRREDAQDLVRIEDDEGAGQQPQQRIRLQQRMQLEQQQPCIQTLDGESSASAMRRGDALIMTADGGSGLQERYDGIWLVNEGAAEAAMMSGEERASRWRRAGLAAHEGIREGQRLYRVSVANLEPYEARRVTGAAFRPGRAGRSAPAIVAARDDAMDGWPDSPPLRRAARAAVRALYALGLDIGEADIALDDAGKPAVVDARPLAPDTLRGAAALRRFAAMHAAAIAAAEDRRPILIGADPEFALLTPEGKLAPASRYFGVGAGGAAGADAMLVGRRLLYPVAELRPAPAATPAALAANVRRLLARAAALVRDPELRWVAGAMPLPGLALGGHIHISGAPLTGRLLRLLDSCVAYPLALVEDPAGRGRRPRYGALGDFRPQPHGGFEYRTPPSWLVSPAAAKAAFALALLCAREALSMPRLPAGEERYAAAYYAGDRTELAGCLEPVAAAVAATGSYEALAHYIEPLFEAARRGDTWNESADIRKKWRIPLKP